MYLSSGTRQGGCMSSPAQGLPGGVGVAFDAGEPVPMVTVRSLLLLCCLLCVIVHGAADSKRLCGSPSVIGGIVHLVCAEQCGAPCWTDCKWWSALLCL